MSSNKYIKMMHFLIMNAWCFLKWLRIYCFLLSHIKYTVKNSLPVNVVFFCFCSRHYLTLQETARLFCRGSRSGGKATRLCALNSTIAPRSNSNYSEPNIEFQNGNLKKINFCFEYTLKYMQTHAFEVWHKCNNWRLAWLSKNT